MNGLLGRLNHTGSSASGSKERRPKKARQPVTSHRNKFESRIDVPVMVRGSASGLPLQKRRTNKAKARRRYDFTLNVPGAEMRLPALPQIAFGMRLVSGLMVIGLAAMVYFLWNSSTFRVPAAEISGLQRLSLEDVNALLNVSGKPVFGLSTSVMENQLKQAFPEFSEVSIKIGFPNQVRVSVVERTPILTWKQDGRTILVDANGVAFPQRELSSAAPALTVDASGAPNIVQPDTTQINGTANAAPQSQFISVDMVSAILSMSAVAPQNSTLIYSKDHGLGWKDAQGWEAFFGDVRDIDMKLKVYQALVKQIKKEKLKPVLISVEYVHNPYYRLEK